MPIYFFSSLLKPMDMVGVELGKIDYLNFKNPVLYFTVGFITKVMEVKCALYADVKI